MSVVVVFVCVLVVFWGEGVWCFGFFCLFVCVCGGGGGVSFVCFFYFFFFFSSYLSVIMSNSSVQLST